MNTVKITVQKSRLAGAVVAPPSKSMAHRNLICAALAAGKSTVYGIAPSADVTATLNCLSALGVSYEKQGTTVTVFGGNFTRGGISGVLDCNESGSTLRFMIPICMLAGGGTLTGSARLLERPLSVYADICRVQGISFLNDGKTVRVGGGLHAGDFYLPGDVSSQFISGLLFVLPLLDGDSRVILTPPVESRSYMEMTISALAQFGVRAAFTDENTIFVRGGQRYLPADVHTEGDYSNAAFLEALNLFAGNAVTVNGLSADSLQGDRVYRGFFPLLAEGRPTFPIGDCPDLAPILMAVAAAKHGVVLTGTRRLKIKESDRAAVMAEELAKFGAKVTVGEDVVTVDPVAFHAPDVPLCGHNDHRVVMALSTLLLLTGGELAGAEAVAKSYPDYFETVASLGAKLCKEEMA